MNEYNMTASSIRAMQDTKYHYMRGVVENFLSETSALDLNTSLVHLLISIDDSHKKEVRELKSMIERMAYDK